MQGVIQEKLPGVCIAEEYDLERASTVDNAHLHPAFSAHPQIRAMISAQGQVMLFLNADKIITSRIFVTFSDQ